MTSTTSARLRGSKGAGEDRDAKNKSQRRRARRDNAERDNATRRERTAAAAAHLLRARTYRTLCKGESTNHEQHHF